MDGAFGLVRRRVELDKGTRLGDDMPTGVHWNELLRAGDLRVERLELGPIQALEVGDRAPARAVSAGVSRSCSSGGRGRARLALRRVVGGRKRRETRE